MYQHHQTQEHAAKVLAVSDEKAVKRAEKDFLKSMDGSSQSDEENQPPQRKGAW